MTNAASPSVGSSLSTSQATVRPTLATPTTPTLRTTSRSRSRNTSTHTVVQSTGDHYVTFTATFAVAFRHDARDHALFNESVRKVQESNTRTAENSLNGYVRTKQGVSMEAPKPKHYFHSEFTLLQDGQRFDTDVVTYGVACKLFREGETKLLRTFEDEQGGKTWYVYKMHHQIKVTEKALDSIYNTPVKIKLWESKEKCIPRARFERPKAFRFQEACLSAPSEGYSLGISNNDFPHSIPQQSVNPAFADQVNYICNSQVFEQRVGKFSGVLREKKTPMTTLGAEHATMTKEQARVANRRRKLQQESEAGHTSQESVAPVKSTRPNSASKLPHIQAELDLSVLFAGFKTVTSRGKVNPTAVSLGSGVRDMFVTFSIDRDLLTDEQKAKVNPLVFRIKSISNLPDTPISKMELEKRCKPVYCSYTFCGLKHHTHDKNRGSRKKVIFDDVKVFLVGRMDINKIIEQFQVQPLEIELHDRDQKTGADMIGTKNDANRPMLFGEDPNDATFGKNMSLVRGSARSRTSTFLDPSKSDSHGIARINLKGLLDGSTTYISGKLPVVPSSVKSSAGIPCGHYLQSDTEMHIEVSLAAPLKDPQNMPDGVKRAREYQMIAFVFDNNNSNTCKFLQNLKHFIADHNKSHFQMDNMSTIMTTYQLDDNLAMYESSQWISGFHLFDGKQHAVLLEAHLAVIENNVAETFIPQVYNGTERICEVLYDTTLVFSERQYTHNPILYTTKLHKSMGQILANPKMYIEEHKDLVQAVLTFWNLRTCKTIREAMKTRSMPTRQQLLILEKTLGVPVYSNASLFASSKTSKDDSTSTENAGAAGEAADQPAEYQRKHRCLTPLDHANPEFLEARDLYFGDHKTLNVVDKNKKIVHKMSKIIKRQNKERMGSDRPYTAAFDGSIIKNYIARHRITERSKTMSRLADVYKRRPNPNHGPIKRISSSAFKDRVDADLLAEKYFQERKCEQQQNARRPRFTAFGHKTAIESNRHVRKPHEDRCRELHMQWVENTLHAGTLEPTLPERGLKEQDMRLYFGKMDLFDPTIPVSIILGGDRKTEEINEVKELDHAVWKEKLVADPMWKFCRQNSGTEQKVKLGPQFRLDNLKGILKDEPVRNNLKKFPVHDIPALPVFDK